MGNRPGKEKNSKKSKQEYSSFQAYHMHAMGIWDCQCSKQVVNSLKSDSCFVLEPNLKSKIPQRLIQSYQYCEMNNSFQYVNLKHGRIQNEGWDKIFPFVKIIKTLELRFSQNNLSSILISLSHISFPNLKRLELQDNNIASIQVLAFFDLPALQQIDFKFNLILQLKPIFKLQTNNLKEATIEDNLWRDWSVNRIKCSKSFKRFGVSISHGSKKYRICNQFAKLESKSCMKIALSSELLGVENKKAQISLKKKYEVVQIV